MYCPICNDYTKHRLESLDNDEKLGCSDIVCCKCGKVSLRIANYLLTDVVGNDITYSKKEARYVDRLYRRYRICEHCNTEMDPIYMTGDSESKPSEWTCRKCGNTVKSSRYVE